MSDQWPPGPPQNNNGGYPPQNPYGHYGQPPKSNAKWYATIGALLVVIAGLISVTTGFISIGSADALQVTDAAEPPPVFEPAYTEGADPFFPLQEQLVGFEQETGEVPTQQAVATGLYGGTAENTCDPQRLIDFLMRNPDKGRAWAHVQGIEFEQIPAYIGSLRVRVLAEPATVLNHGFDAASGAPYQIETTLDAGTAVLIDEKGHIRTRCYCGNPIKPKPIGHKPPRCVQVPTMVYTTPGGNERRDGVPGEVLLTGRVTTDLAWSEISWGPSELETGWTPANNLHRYLCFVVLPPPAMTPTPTPTWTPGPTPTWTPGPTPTPTVWPTPTPTWTPGPTPTPTPTWTPGPTPTPTPTFVPTPTPTSTTPPRPLQINCFITDTDLMVGEQTEFSAIHVPGDVAVTYAFDHGDGTIDRRNPSTAFYEAPGSYDVYVLFAVDGIDDRKFCGTVTVKPAGGTLRLGCSINNTRPAVGETITLTARTLPEDPSAQFLFDHGDGYQEVANPSFAVYRDPGDYEVRVTGTLDGQSRTLFCGTVSVSGTKVCSTSGYENLTLSEAGALADSRGCAHRVAGQPGDTQYRTDRVNFTMSSHGRVQSVAIG